MNKASYLAASLFSIGFALSPSISSAAVVQTAQELLSVCPALSTSTGCPEGAAQYLKAVNPSNGAIITLVTSIADAAESPQVPKRICLDAAQGIRVLAGGVSNADQRQQILVIADELCRGAATAAIPALPGTGNNNGNNNGNGQTGNGGSGGAGGGSGGDGGSGGGDGGNGGACAGNSTAGNGNNCNNQNRSHSH